MHKYKPNYFLNKNKKQPVAKLRGHSDSVGVVINSHPDRAGTSLAAPSFRLSRRGGMDFPPSAEAEIKGGI